MYTSNLYPRSFHTHGRFVLMVVSYPQSIHIHGCLYPQSFCTHISCFVPMHGRFISTVVLYPWLFCIQSFHTQIQSICTQFEPVCTQMAGSFLPVPIYIHSKYLTRKHMNTCQLLCMTNQWSQAIKIQAKFFCEYLQPCQQKINVIFLMNQSIVYTFDFLDNKSQWKCDIFSILVNSSYRFVYLFILFLL